MNWLSGLQSYHEMCLLASHFEEDLLPHHSCAPVHVDVHLLLEFLMCTPHHPRYINDSIVLGQTLISMLKPKSLKQFRLDFGQKIEDEFILMVHSKLDTKNMRDFRLRKANCVSKDAFSAFF